MKISHALLCVFLSLNASFVLAQWQWLDASGNKVFSDAPPPQEITDKNIIKRPAAALTAGGKPLTSTANLPTVSGSAPVAPVAKTATSPKNVGKDIELEKKKAQAQTEEAAKKKAEEQKNAAIRAENCDRAQRNLTSLQSGVRLAQVNAQGEREYLSDEARQSEVQRTQGIVASECKP